MPGDTITHHKKTNAGQHTDPSKPLTHAPHADPQNLQFFRTEKHLETHYPCTRIDAIREKLSKLPAADLAKAAEELLKAGKLSPEDSRKLSEALKLQQANNSPEARSALESSLSASLIHLKMERIKKFNTIKQEILSSKSPDQMEKFLKLSLSEGVISKKEYEKLHRILEKHGLKATGSAYNECLYKKSVILEAKYSKAATQSSEKLKTAAGKANTDHAVPEQRSSIQPHQQRHTTQTQLALSILNSIDEAIHSAHPPTQTQTSRILDSLGEAAQKKIEEKHEEHKKECEESKKKEEHLVEDLLRKYSHLNLSRRDIQTKFAHLERLPPEALEELAKRISKELHPGHDTTT